MKLIDSNIIIYSGAKVYSWLRELFLTLVTRNVDDFLHIHDLDIENPFNNK